MKKLIAFFVVPFLFLGCKEEPKKEENNDAIKSEAQAFLDEYTKTYVKLYYDSSLAEWDANTHIVAGDTTNAHNVQKANEAFAKFTGSTEVIEKTRKFLEDKDKLDITQVRQLNTILYSAANNPETVSDLVSKRITAENAQNEMLFGYDFKVDGKSVSTGDIDEVLRTSNDEKVRLKNWESSKAVGQPLKNGLENLRNLRNETVGALGYDDYFSYQVSDYGMTRQEMLDEMNKMVKEVWPLYRELHTWARYELAKKYNAKEVPEYLPAHWLPNRWGQDWSALVNVEGLDIDAALKDKQPEWIVKEGEKFYVSIGFEPLPTSFYEKSSMYPLPADADFKKNNHASAWHMDLENDLRCLMSVEPTAEYYETIHHELGHIYYYQAYTNPNVPPLLRGGANRGFHEAIGSLLGLAAMQKPFLAEKGLVDANVKIDETQNLLKEALNYVVFLPFSAGVMTEFENSLYAENLPKDQFNKKWWELAKKYQGMVPPTDRGEEFNDAASKTHINNDAAQYYDYAISYILLFQIHDHISKNILKQDPHATNYYGSKEVGTFLKDVLKTGANNDWRELLKESVGSGMSAKPMLDYFQPLMAYLKEQNKGRTYTLPENL
ncbi:M2 family metallopeptidase [Subsaxibacter sp. CAU 1640]|uniref:M2 family metallopeptidase n=1 Tax=Subsaxibacter sp. CAU 1640 TaxID=2933271 RepID=UPI002005AFBD|nr:M2 family metallopeptidase [Subsaxibacter sp. CAU 1640]MCK7591812.1 M2 family metallopeptidase [Subsaxibacter sp. CAU 1640]